MQPNYGSNLGDMVAPDQIRRSIRRLFPNSPAVILGEILQNSQRAGAKHVDFALTPTGFTCVDDGHGLQDGARGFHALLQMGRSRFQRVLVDDQDPMGLGIHSILACDGIAEVTFASQGLHLHIDTARWWEEQPYYTSWFKRLEEEIRSTQGFAIEVVCTAAITEQIRHLLLDVSEDHRAPARGYEGILAITCDGTAVRTDIPRVCFPRHRVIETTYEGNRLTIGFGTRDPYATSSSYVTWYGQLIADGFHDTVRYCLEVKDGRPVHPLAPVRSSLIQDSARARLHAFVWEAVFAYLRDPANRDQLHASWVRAAYNHDETRACREFPFFVAKSCEAASTLEQLEDLAIHGCSRIWDYDSAPLVIDPERLLVVIGEQRETYVYGLATVLPMLDQPYELICGDRSRVQTAVVWWCPGASLTSPCQRHDFRAAGEWGLGTDEIAPDIWCPVTCPVIALQEGDCCDVRSVSFLIGNCPPEEFYGELAWAGFAPDEDDPYDPQHDDYATSCDDLMRKMIGDCVPVHFTLAHIQAWMADRLARIETLTYCYVVGATQPFAIEVVNAVGERKRLRCYR